MTVKQELAHLITAPFDIWQVVRISSGNTPASLDWEVKYLDEEINYLTRFTTYRANVKRVGRRIYLQKRKR